jgi:hypothetical protein
MAPRLHAERDLRLLDISAYPHWSGSKNDSQKGNRARQQFRTKLVAVALGPESGYDSQGRYIVDHNMGNYIRQWLGGYRLAID